MKKRREFIFGLQATQRMIRLTPMIRYRETGSHAVKCLPKDSVLISVPTPVTKLPLLHVHHNQCIQSIKANSCRAKMSFSHRGMGTSLPSRSRSPTLYIYYKSSLRTKPFPVNITSVFRKRSETVKPNCTLPYASRKPIQQRLVMNGGLRSEASQDGQDIHVSSRGGGFPSGDPSHPLYRAAGSGPGHQV